MSSTAGFAQHASGLYVPEEVSREREVWLREEWAALERATKLLTSRGLEFHFCCPKAECAGEPIERRRNLDGGITLRCNHKDRVVVRFRK